MNFLVPTGVDLSGKLAVNPGDKPGYSNPMRFEHSDRAYVGKKCFGSNGFTRFMEFKDGGNDNTHFTLTTNDNNYVEFKALDNVPPDTDNQLVGYIGIQPKCETRQIKFDFKGLFSAFCYGTRLMLWRNIHFFGSSVDQNRQYYWRGQSFGEVNALSLATGNEFVTQTGYFSANGLKEQEQFEFDDDFNEQTNEWETINYTQDNEQGFELTAEMTLDLEPRACPHMFCLSATNDETANIANGYVLAKITLID